MLSGVPVDAVRAVVRLSRLFERSLDSLSLAQYRVLAQIAAGDERASRIARRLALGKPAVSATVESLRQRGLLVRGGLDEDRRVTPLSLTPQGRSVLDAAERVMTEALGEVLTHTPDSDAAGTVLLQLGDALEEILSERARRQDR